MLFIFGVCLVYLAMSVGVKGMDINGLVGQLLAILASEELNSLKGSRESNTERKNFNQGEGQRKIRVLLLKHLEIYKGAGLHTSPG